MLGDLFRRGKKKLEQSNPDVDFIPVGFISKDEIAEHDRILFRTDEGEELNPDGFGRFITLELDEDV